jgi:integrase/recombinase XerD
MFTSLYSYPAVLKRHQEGPLAAERAAYLERLAARGIVHDTVLRRAVLSLCVAQTLVQTSRASNTEPWTEAEIDALATQWATQRVAQGRATTPHWPRIAFRAIAIELLTSCGRFQKLAVPPGPYHTHVEDFLTAQAEHGPSEQTQRSRRWQVHAFLSWLGSQGCSLQSIRPEDLDLYFQHVSKHWSRVSIHTAGTVLKSWFRHAERRGWVQSGLAATILLPRIYRYEGLPAGPSWEQVGAMINRIEGEDPPALRARALLRLLATYGLRSGEVRRLRLDDLDWAGAQLRIVRSKSHKPQTLPLEPGVGEAIAQYLQHGRPKSTLRTVFLTLREPYRPLSLGGLYHIVEHHLAAVATVTRGRGPHGLRHACARRLLESGRSFKEVSDHLGHCNPDTAGIYAKVNLEALRRVALTDLGVQP